MNLFQDEASASTAACGRKEKMPFPGEKLPLAIASVPIQPWEAPSAPAAGLKQGSIFPGLVLPFFKEGGSAHV